MRFKNYHIFLFVCFLCTLLSPALYAAFPLLDFAVRGFEKKLIPSSSEVFVAPGGLVTIQTGTTEYPGVTVKPEGQSHFDLSKFAYVEVRLSNMGAKPLTVSLRVDNDGDWQAEPWNTERVRLEPGASDHLRVYFGSSYGQPGFALNPAKVPQVLLYAGWSDTEQSFQIESLTAGGVPGEKRELDPNAIRLEPKGGVLVGEGVTTDIGQQIICPRGSVSAEGNALKVVIQSRDSGLPPPLANTTPEQIMVKPPIGRWNLRDFLQVRVKLRNNGKVAVLPRVRLESEGGPSDLVKARDLLEPGAEQELIIPFFSTQIWTGLPWPAVPFARDGIGKSKPGEGTQFASDAVSGVTVMLDRRGVPQSVLIESITAELPSYVPPEYPLGVRPPVKRDWVPALGGALRVTVALRPPVEGDWVQTFNEDFDGAGISDDRWNFYSENWWDPKKTHFTKDNVIVSGGNAALRYEKKTGFQNDDPTQLETPYATGYLNTLGKWTQRYGYFEARMKLPQSPGLWPAFWMMPDRGAGAVDREETTHGGMEFDIMEHLTRWGPYRYNIAMHWDGYGKDHRSLGSDKIYVRPDRQGYITCGVLWTPGELVYYCNGREVLRWKNERVSSVPSYLIFYMPSAGWDNDAIDDSRLPADFLIDYVRVWQRKDLASPADSPSSLRPKKK